MSPNLPSVSSTEHIRDFTAHHHGDTYSKGRLVGSWIELNVADHRVSGGDYSCDSGLVARRRRRDSKGLSAREKSLPVGSEYGNALAWRLVCDQGGKILVKAGEGRLR